MRSCQNAQQSLKNPTGADFENAGAVPKWPKNGVSGCPLSAWLRSKVLSRALRYPFRIFRKGCGLFLSWPSELRNRPGASGASGGPRFRGGLLGFGAPLGPPAGLGGPPGASGVPPGASGGPRGGLGGISGALSLFLGLDVGFGSGFRVFWPPSTSPCLADPKFQHFPGHLLETAGQWAPRATPRKPPKPRSLGLGFLNNLVNHRKGEGVP